MLTEELMQGAQKYLMDTYARYPLALARGQGTRVYDVEGREYLDFLAGVAVNVLGHCHQKVTQALQQQALRLVHTSNLFYTEPQVKLARTLVDHSFAAKVLFCNGGAEAHERAIKLARRSAHAKDGAGRFEIVSMLNSFHGRTLATLTATGQEKVQKGFEPLPEGFRHVPFNDGDALASAVSAKTAAVLVEPVQGEGGVRVAALAVLEVVLEDKDILGHCTQMGEYFMKGLKDLQGRCPAITDIQGLGLMIGVEVTMDARELVHDLRKRGILINATSERKLRFVPPLIVTHAEIDRVVTTLGDVIEARR